MLDFNVIQAYDQRAMNLGKAEADKNVYEFDLTLWSLVSSLAKKNPEDAAIYFSLTTDAALAIANATPEQLRHLASGNLISFVAVYDRQEVVAKYREPYDPASLFNYEAAEFDIAFWYLLNRSAQQDFELAIETFGVSPDVAAAVKDASHSQIHYVSSTIITGFEIRVSSKLIVEILSTEVDLVKLRLKKYQQSLLSHHNKVGNYTKKLVTNALSR